MAKNIEFSAEEMSRLEKRFRKLDLVYRNLSLYVKKSAPHMIMLLSKCVLQGTFKLYNPNRGLKFISKV